MASSSSPFAVSALGKYDVFLSFRGEDTRNSFTNFLHGLLTNKGLDVFIDDDLPRGDEIAPALLNAIEESTVSIIIFSKHYASSRWCLQELDKILDCKKNPKLRQIVMPVFYHVEPTDVRKQTGAFGDAFQELVERCKYEEQTERWRDALTEAANISGQVLSEQTPEYPVASKIVQDVLEILNHFYPSYKKGLVGVQPIVDHIIYNLLQIYKLKIVRAVGIWGMGGIGKTTIAEAIFNRIRTQFEDSFFAGNVREESERANGLTSLKQEFLSSILGEKHSNTNSFLTKRRFGRKKVLIVFDDVTSLTQIELLIGDLNCLGQGSRIIITTRDREVLINCGVGKNMIYRAEGLSRSDAIRLFSFYAFRHIYPNKDYVELSNSIVTCCHGVPLALKVLGSSLIDKSKEVWESAISRLENILDWKIHNVLKLSYDELDISDKDIFLDIALFLKGEDRDFIVQLLDAFGHLAEFGIAVLIDRCLLTLTGNKITMHDLLEEMGREIIRQESLKDPGKRSRLANHEDICSVLKENAGTRTIEGICLDMSKEIEIIHLDPKALTHMRKLRFLRLYNSPHEENNINKVHVSQGLYWLSSDLRYLCWHGCPLKSLSKFCPDYLMLLEMPRSSIKKLWSTGAELRNLKHVDLSYAKSLIHIPDLLRAPNLERLILEGCTSLYEIPSSINCLNKLVVLNLKHCKNLSNFPSGLHLESLEILLLSFCSNLKLFPDISSNLRELYLDETAIEELSPSIENLSRLVILDLRRCSMLERLPSNFCKLKSLEYLDLSGCSKLDGLPDNLGNLESLKVLKAESLVKSEIPPAIACLSLLIELNLTACCINNLPDSLGQLSSLERLLLGRNNCGSLPTSIIELSKLSYLDLCYCTRLQSLPQLPCCLQNIDAHCCTSLEAPPSLSPLFNVVSFREVRVNFSNCFELHQDALKENVKEALQIRPPRRKGFNPRSSAACICYPGIEIPDWFMFQSTTSFITLELSEDVLPSLLDGVSFALCAIVEFRNYRNDGQGLVVFCDCWFRNEIDGEESYYGSLKGWDRGSGSDYVGSDHVFIGYDLRLQFPLPHKNSFFRFYDSNVRLQFYVENLNAERIASCNVKKCGVHLLHTEIQESSGSYLSEEEVETSGSFISEEEKDEAGPSKRLKD